MIAKKLENTLNHYYVVYTETFHWSKKISCEISVSRCLGNNHDKAWSLVVQTVSLTNQFVRLASTVNRFFFLICIKDFDVSSVYFCKRHQSTKCTFFV